jgi:hypothetical protein
LRSSGKGDLRKPVEHSPHRPRPAERRFAAALISSLRGRHGICRLLDAAISTMPSLNQGKRPMDVMVVVLDVAFWLVQVGKAASRAKLGRPVVGCHVFAKVHSRLSR